jgi:beta-glucosidase
LRAFERIFLKPAERRTVDFTLTPRQLSYIDGNGLSVVSAGDVEMSVGGKQPGFHGTADAPTTQVVTATLHVVGKTFTVPERSR